ncbi:citrate/2-methylcitrate synthase [Tsukamurella sp. 8F]|uniref:citrate/2-methylcitrate synthase n=1 Tax=unclassified Tsukamurella TaxID=2633480 RepID=UPI0023B900F1|nr:MULTISPECIES: citrate/2-methylcitrate synthase [unclassified Tsukamurella]MDF0532043.1 citrate/2-methylcitrate synthase [Tsukamurella sp. 8J]MDF0587526.1 citrate/2-methylcitrate synthase [Tsukamurella sp. 8F]
MQTWITTSEAAQRLGVKRGTLYSYVSRGILTSTRRPGQEESLFDRAEVDALAAAKHDGRRAGERLLRFRSVATKVSSITPRGLSLRGVPIETVCAEMDFAHAAAFVLQHSGSVPAAPDLDVARVRRVPLERRIPLAVAEIAAEDPLRGERAGLSGRTLALLGTLATVVPEIPFEHPWLQVYSTCLIDNGLAVAATAARVAASTRAGLYDTLSAGLGAMAGPLHGGAPVHAYELLAAVAAGDDPDVAITRAVRRTGRVPGFGHIVYTGDDPRARVVLDLLGGEAVLAAVDALCERVERPVNVDLAGAAVCLALGLPAGAPEVVFQYSRIVGMAAHVAEEYDEAPLRWRGRADV